MADNVTTFETGAEAWDHVFTVSPLVVIGTREEDGSYDLAPKHMVMPLGWGDYYAFVCTPRHRTHGNVVREGFFTASYPRPDQVLLASLAAAPRVEDGTKPSVGALPLRPAEKGDGVLLADASLALECELTETQDRFGDASLVIGRIVAAHIDRGYLRVSDEDDSDLIARAPLLAFIPPGRYAMVERTAAFPYHKGFER